MFVLLAFNGYTLISLRETIVTHYLKSVITFLSLVSIIFFLHLKIVDSENQYQLAMGIEIQIVILMSR